MANFFLSFPRRTRAVTAVLVLSLAVCFPAFAAGAEVDAFVTNSVGNAVQVDARGFVVEKHRKGSRAFQAAASLLRSRDYSDAYAAARGLPNIVERRAIQWAAIYHGYGAIEPDAVARFAKDAPHFATEKTYRMRTEAGVARFDPPDAQIINQLGGRVPVSVDGKIALANAYRRNGQMPRAMKIVRPLWRTYLLDAKIQSALLKHFGSQLNRDDHWQRTIHLMMKSRTKVAEVLIGRLSPAQRTLLRARIAVVRRHKNAAAKIDAVDPSLRSHPVFYFTKAQYSRRIGSISKAAELLDAPMGEKIDLREWWHERRTVARKLVDVGKPGRAYKVANNFKVGPKSAVSEAQFFAGWVALRKMNKPDLALKNFKAQRLSANSANEISQSEYWAAEALLKMGQRDAGIAQLRKAAQWQTAFYGQLAGARLSQKRITLRGLPQWRGRVSSFERDERVQAIRLLAGNGLNEQAEPLLVRLAYQKDHSGDMLLTARLAQDIDAHNRAIQVADLSKTRGTPLDLFAYPKDGLPAGAKLASVDKAFVYAIARQESHFNKNVISSAGARGLMQLMPATAKETAHKMGIAYKPERLLTDPAYNAAIGSTYLHAQLKRFDGSLIMAAAAYNAGGGNVNKWIKAYGDPRAESIDPVEWIEHIPYTETRTYVKLVMANYQIYTARLGRDSLTIRDDLRRISY